MSTASRRAAASAPRTAPVPGHGPEARPPETSIPNLRAGSFFPALLERCRRVDQVLFAVVLEAYVHGVDPKSRRPVKALGAETGISKSEVSRICDLDTEVAAFRDRTLAAQDCYYVFLDATYCTARVGHTSTLG